MGYPTMGQPLWDSFCGITFPWDNLPRDNLPRDSLPWDSLPWDSLHWDNLPQDALPYDDLCGAPHSSLRGNWILYSYCKIQCVAFPTSHPVTAWSIADGLAFPRTACRGITCHVIIYRYHTVVYTVVK